MSVTEQKENLRQYILQRKRDLTRRDIILHSEAIFNNLEQTDIFRRAEVIMGYWSFGKEVFTHNFLQKWYREKTILLPVIDREKLQVKKFEGSDFLQKDIKTGIYQPASDIYPPDSPIDLILVPGIAFDRNCSRLGRGKAYYDKFLVHVNSYKIGVCFDFQLIEKVPVSENDIAMDAVITESGIYYK